MLHRHTLYSHAQAVGSAVHVYLLYVLILTFSPDDSDSGFFPVGVPAYGLRLSIGCISCVAMHIGMQYATTATATIYIADIADSRRYR